MTPETVAPGSESYTVRKGDTACGIARALQVNCRELIRMNRLGKRALIRIGQKLEIPRRLVVVKEPADRGPAKTVVKRAEGDELTALHKVKRGETACKIAENYGVSCRELINVNSLGRKATIYVGQRLVIPGQTVTHKAVLLDENNRYLVKKGDFACSIARRLQVSCNDLRKVNNLDKKATIYPGQKLVVPGLELQNTNQTAEALANVKQVAEKADSSSTDVVTSPGLSNLLDSLPDLSVSITDNNGAPVYRIWVEADETLGHYADWLGMGSTSSLRSLNGLSKSTVRLGQSLKLPVKDASIVTRFEQKRIEYHQVLSEELKQYYELAGVRKYKVQSGDSVWSLSDSFGFPVWLFYRLNPEYKISRLNSGEQVLIPELAAKQ